MITAAFENINIQLSSDFSRIESFLVTIREKDDCHGCATIRHERFVPENKVDSIQCVEEVSLLIRENQRLKAALDSLRQPVVDVPVSFGDGLVRPPEESKEFYIDASYPRKCVNPACKNGIYREAKSDICTACWMGGYRGTESLDTVSA